MLASLAAPVSGASPRGRGSERIYFPIQRENWSWLGVVNIWYFRQVGDVPPDRAAYYFALVDPEFNPRPVYEALRQAAQEFLD